MTTDRAAGATLVFFGLVTIFESRAFPLGSLHRPGPAFMPALLAALLILFGIAVFTMGARAPRLLDVGWVEWKHAVAIFAACAFTALALERLGYRLTIFAALLALTIVVEKKGWIAGLVFAGGFSLGTYYLFNTLLRVPLPQGLFGL